MTSTTHPAPGGSPSPTQPRKLWRTYLQFLVPMIVANILQSLSGTLNGSGSTFQKAFEEVAITKFAATTKDVKINYVVDSNGVDFADASDNKKRAQLDFMVIAFDNTGKEVAHASDTLDATVPLDAYAAIQKSYKALAKQIEPDHRIDHHHRRDFAAVQHEVADGEVRRSHSGDPGGRHGEAG